MPQLRCGIFLLAVDMSDEGVLNWYEDLCRY